MTEEEEALVVAKAIHEAFKKRMVSKGAMGPYTRYSWDQQTEEAQQDFLNDARAALECHKPKLAAAEKLSRELRQTGVYDGFGSDRLAFINANKAVEALKEYEALQ